MNETVTLLYIPCPSAEIARNIVHTLLEERLIACANLIPGGESHYRWQGQLVQESECYLLVKTISTKAEAARERIASLHPYETPAILSFEATANGPFAVWVHSETQK